MEVQHAAVREGYQLLLRADSQLLLPMEKARICEFYRRMSDACLKWATAAEGERIRSAYLSMESNRERAHLRLAVYQLSCKPVFERGAYVAWVCESVMRGEGKETVRRMAQVWNVEEETMLPMRQILELFRVKRSCKRPAFRPDGVYPMGEDLVFFKNADGREEMKETRVPFSFFG
jgi:hypothetical protein